MVLRPPQARVRSGPQGLEASSRRLAADNAYDKNDRVANSKSRVIKDQ
jgi:hypothetical protein